MDTKVFDAAMRVAAEGVSRRASLFTLGGAALAAGATNADVTEAKKKGNKCKKKANQRCSNDKEACRNTVLINCEIPEGCPEALLCCESCSANDFLICLLAASGSSMTALK